MSILINKDTRVMTQGITGKTGMFHTKTGKEYANGKNCYVAGVTPKKGGQNYEGIPIFNSVREAKDATGANVSVIYVPPPFAAAAIEEAVDADLDLVICITEGIPVRDMLEVRNKMKQKEAEAERQRAAERRREAVCSPFMRIARFPVDVARELLDWWRRTRKSKPKPAPKVGPAGKPPVPQRAVGRAVTPRPLPPPPVPMPVKRRDRPQPRP